MNDHTATIQLLSDTHLEFHLDGGRGFIEDLDPTGVDVLVVAGDFATVPLLASRLTQICERYPQVIYVAGNHEFYRSSPFEVETVLGGIEDELGNLNWLRRNTVSVGGLMFAGTTLWFENLPGNAQLSDQLSDFRYVEGFVPWVYEENERDMAFLRRSAARADVVVTHHLPSYRCVHPRFVGSSLNRFFVSDLEDVLEAPAGPSLWLHGHTHDSVDLTVNETRIVANPFGYRGQTTNPGYDPRLLIKVHAKTQIAA